MRFVSWLHLWMEIRIMHSECCFPIVMYVKLFDRSVYPKVLFWILQKKIIIIILTCWLRIMFAIIMTCRHWGLDVAGVC